MGQRYFCIHEKISVQKTLAKVNVFLFTIFYSIKTKYEILYIILSFKMEIFAKTYEAGSKATYLSGSGPTIVSVLDGNYFEFNAEMQRFFKENAHKWTCMILSVDNVGAVVSVRS